MGTSRDSINLSRRAEVPHGARVKATRRNRSDRHLPAIERVALGVGAGLGEGQGGRAAPAGDFFLPRGDPYDNALSGPRGGGSAGSVGSANSGAGGAAGQLLGGTIKHERAVMLLDPVGLSTRTPHPAHVQMNRQNRVDRRPRGVGLLSNRNRIDRRSCIIDRLCSGWVIVIELTPPHLMRVHRACR